MIVSVKPCVNCGAIKISDFMEYKGCLGYEALICKKCGTTYDNSGVHVPEINNPYNRKGKPQNAAQNQRISIDSGI